MNITKLQSGFEIAHRDHRYYFETKSGHINLQCLIDTFARPSINPEPLAYDIGLAELCVKLNPGFGPAFRSHILGKSTNLYQACLSALDQVESSN